MLIGLKLRQSSQSAKGDLARLRRRPLRRPHLESIGSVNSSKDSPPYFSTSIESIEVNNNNNNNNSTMAGHPHKQLKEMPSFASINSNHSLTFASGTNGGPGGHSSYIDHRHRSRLSKFTSSTSSASSASGGSSLAQRRQVIKMLSKCPLHRFPFTHLLAVVWCLSRWLVIRSRLRGNLSGQ